MGRFPISEFEITAKRHGSSVELLDDTVISLRSWVSGAATWRENSYYLAITPLHLSPSAIIS